MSSNDFNHHLFNSAFKKDLVFTQVGNKKYRSEEGIKKENTLPNVFLNNNLDLITVSFDLSRIPKLALSCGG